MDFRICSITDEYIKFLRHYYSHVYDNKEFERVNTRKYLGVVFQNSGYNYYIPMSTPKDGDYEIRDGQKAIKKDTLTIKYIVDHDELKGKLILSNMIPVPDRAIVPYDFDAEQNDKYKALIKKEWAVIKKSRHEILEKAKVLYNKKIHEIDDYIDRPLPEYLKATLDYKGIEEKCNEYDYLKSQQEKYEKIKQEGSPLYRRYDIVVDKDIIDKVRNQTECAEAITPDKNKINIAISGKDKEILDTIENAVHNCIR